MSNFVIVQQQVLRVLVKLNREPPALMAVCQGGQPRQVHSDVLALEPHEGLHLGHLQEGS